MDEASQVYFQKYQFDKGLNRMKQGRDQVPVEYVRELGGDKEWRWEMRRKLGPLREILLDIQEDGE